MEKPRRRSSFFGYNTSTKNTESAYIEQLTKELKDGCDYLSSINNKFKTYWRNVKESNEEGDDAIMMSKERNEFLNRKVDMKKYLEESQEIADEIDFYINRKEWFIEKFDMLLEDLHDKEIYQRVRQCRLLQMKQESIATSPPLSHPKEEDINKDQK